MADAEHELRTAVKGPVYRRGQAGYDAVRRPWRRNVDPRPLLAVEPLSTEDVVNVVRTALGHALPLAVQATGHGALNCADGGILMSTARMTGVRIDPRRRVARVRAGTRWGEVLAAAAPYGLAPLSGSSPEVGVIGYTLGGGLGWLSRLYGFAADSLVRATLVTAGGEVLETDAEHEPDLWWALRGGGGNFGVVTGLEFRLHPVAEVYAGTLIFPVERALPTLARYREWALTEQDASNTALAVLRLPDRAVLALRVCHAGAAGQAAAHLAPLLAAAGPSLAGGLSPMPFAKTATLTDPQPQAQVSEEHSDLFRALPDEVLGILVESVVAAEDGPALVEVRHWGGALSRDGGGPLGACDALYSVLAVAPELGPHNQTRARARMADLARRLQPYATGGTFLNYLSDPARVPGAFSARAYRRLRELKRRYDPGNVFHLNHNIPPGL
ncbi:FAD-binding oxidoreductase [Nonomuraea typhae]|uniref:FAD-binding oxidoreductase n=1 Tax=Nonomuraea typhae TaxID=2603600 RepID=A0ABW7YQT6_9ACTN